MSEGNVHPEYPHEIKMSSPPRRIFVKSSLFHVCTGFSFSKITALNAFETELCPELSQFTWSEFANTGPCDLELVFVWLNVSHLILFFG